jgi:hypothetical protein
MGIHEAIDFRFMIWLERTIYGKDQVGNQHLFAGREGQI